MQFCPYNTSFLTLKTSISVVSCILRVTNSRFFSRYLLIATCKLLFCTCSSLNARCIFTRIVSNLSTLWWGSKKTNDEFDGFKVMLQCSFYWGELIVCCFRYKLTEKSSIWVCTWFPASLSQQPGYLNMIVWIWSAINFARYNGAFSYLLSILN